MKRVGFFMILGAAVLLLFGCAGNGVLRGVSQEPVGGWLVTLLKDENNNGVYDDLENYFYIAIDVNDDDDGYVPVAVDKYGDPIEEITATFSMNGNKVEFTMERLDVYSYELTGIFHNESDDSNDLMAGEYEGNNGFYDVEGFWFAFRYDFPPAGAAIEGYNPLEGRKDEIEELIKVKTGYEVDLDFFELTK
ncbi:hypothetical protein [Petrotoga sp. 9PWA.NaAc.5.4]|uniref:hypothetical protein n=1 Tax=Petrotoga sp. 9PWA.NaAc.5.4 TaxID=1434328 RepID=UPI000CBF0D36|nr:hypothetical protein [Petrotoga sp. 9PWA.NaAc.5.4]PNR94668.1 hypothetical protein X924_06150 [Petrotoga sp. 9PWA.NaAc.5.4]